MSANRGRYDAPTSVRQSSEKHRSRWKAIFVLALCLTAGCTPDAPQSRGADGARDGERTDQSAALDTLAQGEQVPGPPIGEAQQLGDGGDAELPRLALDPEGLRLIGARTGAATSLPFGMTDAELYRAMLNIRDASIERGVNEECGAGALDYVTWADGLTLYSQGGRFVGWLSSSMDSLPGGDGAPVGPTTVAGIGVGATRAALESAHNIEVRESSLGTEWDAGGLHGLLSSDSAAAHITSLWAGTTCIFR